MGISIHFHLCLLQRAIIAYVTKSILRPAHTSLFLRPESLSKIVSRSTSSDINGQQMIKGWMCLTGIGSLQEVYHGLLSFRRRLRDSVLQSLVKASSVRHWLGVAPSELQVAQVVDCHSRYNDQDILIAELGHRLSELVVLSSILGVEQ